MQEIVNLWWVLGVRDMVDFWPVAAHVVPAAGLVQRRSPFAARMRLRRKLSHNSTGVTWVHTTCHAHTHGTSAYSWGCTASALPTCTGKARGLMLQHQLSVSPSCEGCQGTERGLHQHQALTSIWTSAGELRIYFMQGSFRSPEPSPWSRYSSCSTASACRQG